MNTRRALRVSAVWLALLTLISPQVYGVTAPDRPELPAGTDVRGAHGVPRGTALRAPTLAQVKALGSLESAVGSPLRVRYNGLTATPYHLFSYEGYLSAPSAADPESIARDFLGRWRSIFRFDDRDLGNLKLTSRATIPTSGATVMVFQQYAGGVPVYQGEVMVNVSSRGQIINVGGDSYPRLAVTNGFALAPDQAVTAAAAELGYAGFAPVQVGTRGVPVTFGELAPETVEAPVYGGGGVFNDDITVTRTAFPLGDTARMAYVLTLTTREYQGIMWQSIVDAETGQVLRRTSLTAFLGEPGGGQGVGRRSTLRPDIQDILEANNSRGTALGKVFDAMPTALAGLGGVGRSTGPGDPPDYPPANTTATAAGAGFRSDFVQSRTQSPLIYDVPFSQVTRGFPDAANPSPQSPFGWFYLPTDSAGREIAAGNANRAATRAWGYTLPDEAVARNLPANSPLGDKLQPFSASLTSIRKTALADGRSLSSVFESNYTEGNNVLSADDRANDDEATTGLRGFALGRKFNASYFTFVNSYEFGGVEPTTEGLCLPLTACEVNFPATADPDVYPGTLSLFFYVNVLHDYLYSIGFTEATWNFQQDNFGRGGAGGDGVVAQVQDGSGTDNANFSTPSDGANPRMQMYLFTEAGFRRADGSFDFDIVAHELYHGVSNRSVGKGRADALGNPLVGEPGGQGEGWSDFIAASMADDDAAAEYSTGEFDRGIRRRPVTNYRWSYGGINGPVRNRRDGGHTVGTSVPFETHDVGEVWSAMLWDVRELLIMKDPNGVFFDGTRRLGSGTAFFIGSRQVRSVDALHPIDYRASFDTTDPVPIHPVNAIVRPRLVADEIARLGHRRGPLATAVSNGARLADTLVLHGMQLSPGNPAFVDSRDAILLADRELTGGENQAVIWRAFASHGVGALATSTTSAAGDGAPVIVEDFGVPQGVVEAEQLGPLAAPNYTLSNALPNTVTVVINGGAPIQGATSYIVSRATSEAGPFTSVATIPASQTTFNDDDGGEGLTVRQPFFYKVRAVRNPQSVSEGILKSITLVLGQVITPAPVFDGVAGVADPGQCNQLVLSWKAAGSKHTKKDIVYDVYRVASVAPGNGTQDPAFAPSAANRVASGVRGTSYTDAGLTLGQVYYYIVQARDLSNGKIDTKNQGNRVVRFNAPTSPAVAAPPVFAAETFEGASADTRFAPPLVFSAGGPDQALAAWQRVPNVALGNGTTSSVMYAPNFDPGSDGAPSDIGAVIGPLSLTSTSVLEFDHFFFSEAGFDGGVLEVALGAPVFNATPFPDNTTTFDLGNYIVAGGYDARLDGSQFGVILSALQGRRAWTGSKPFHHVRVMLGSFAPGGASNPLGLPVFVRLRMTSDVGTTAGPASGWYVDNVVVRSMGCG